MLNIILTCRDILCVDKNVDKRCVDHSTRKVILIDLAMPSEIVEPFSKTKGDVAVTNCQAYKIHRTMGPQVPEKN